jgi:hypothetical protein
VSWRARTYAIANALQFLDDAERISEPDLDQGMIAQSRLEKKADLELFETHRHVQRGLVDREMFVTCHANKQE